MGIVTLLYYCCEESFVVIGYCAVDFLLSPLYYLLSLEPLPQNQQSLVLTASGKCPGCGILVLVNPRILLH